MDIDSAYLRRIGIALCALIFAGMASACSPSSDKGVNWDQLDYEKITKQHSNVPSE